MMITTADPTGKGAPPNDLGREYPPTVYLQLPNYVQTTQSRQATAAFFGDHFSLLAHGVKPMYAASSFAHFDPVEIVLLGKCGLSLSSFAKYNCPQERFDSSPVVLRDDLSSDA